MPENVFPSCNSKLKTHKELQDHIESQHPQEKSVSLISTANSSYWMLVSCTICNRSFKCESDMYYHVERIHVYGKTCEMYPCEECGFSGQDKKALKDHMISSHSNTEETSYEKLLESDLDDSGEHSTRMSEFVVGKRIKQNLQNINLDEDSDDDGDWDASQVDDTEDDDIDIKTPPRVERTRSFKRKQTGSEESQPQKKTKPAVIENTGLACDICDVKFIQKDNLKRHHLRKHENSE